jgi:hypothetical protein
MVHARRVIVGAIVYVNRTGCPGGTSQRLPALEHRLRLLRALARRRHPATAGRRVTRPGPGRRPRPRPAAAVIDSQPVRAADTVPWASRVWDNAERDWDNAEKDGAASGTSPSTPPAWCWPW